MKIVYLVVGWIGVGLGILGAALPLLPAFPFLLLAGYCFTRSSKRLNNWFIGSKLYKNNLESFVIRKSMTRKVKLKIFFLFTLTMSVGFLMMCRIRIGQIVLVIVWIFHVIYFNFGIKTEADSTELEVINKEI